MGTMISDNKKFVFIHVPKTAGRSMERLLGQYRRNRNIDVKLLRSALSRVDALAPFGVTKAIGGAIIPEHASYSDLESYGFGQELNEYYSFAIVRDPLKRAYSKYKYGIEQSKSRHLRKEFWDTRNMSFEEWLCYEAKQIQNGTQNTQTGMLIDRESGSIKLNNIIKLENLDRELPELCNDINIEYAPLERINQGSQSVVVFSEEAKGLVADIYKEDYDNFNYELL